MNIVVFGTGGVGGYFGGKLALAGQNVTFIARGKHLSAIRSNGLKVKSIKGDFSVHPNATDSISDIDEVDLFILAVKSWQLDEVADQIKPLVGRHTLVLPLQNGADNAERLRERLADENVLSGLCRIVSRIESVGVIDHFAFKDPEIIFGRDDGKITTQMELLKSIFDEAGIKNKLSEHVQLDIWQKFLFITTVSGMGALTKAVFGVMREDLNIRNMMYQTANEIVAVANAKQIPLSNRDIEETFAAIDNTHYNTTASMQRDIMENRPSELENFNGYIVKMGKQLHILTPVNAFIYYCLLPQERKARTSAD